MTTDPFKVTIHMVSSLDVLPKKTIVFHGVNPQTTMRMELQKKMPKNL